MHAPPTIQARWRHVALVCLLPLAMAACGGGSDSPSPAPTDSVVVGASGGALAHADGVRITVPAGALSESVTLRVARDTTGMNAALVGVAPDPAQSVDLSPTYAMTPHGTRFAEPVELRIPLDKAAATGPGMLAVLRTEPGRGSWELIPVAKVENGAAVVAINGFSYYKAVRVVLIPQQLPQVPPAPPLLEMSASFDGVGPETYTFPSPTNPTNQHRRLYGEISSSSQNLRYAGRVVGLPASCATIALGGMAGFPKSPRAEDSRGGVGAMDNIGEPLFAQANATVGTSQVNGVTRPTLDFAFDLNLANAPYKRTVFEALRAANKIGPTPTVAVSFNAWANCGTPVDLGGGNIISAWQIIPGITQLPPDPFYPDAVFFDGNGWAWNTVLFKLDYLPQGYVTHPSHVAVAAGAAASFSTSAWPTPVGEQRIEWWRSNNDGASWTRVRTSIVPVSDTADTYTLPSVLATDHNALFRARLCTVPRQAAVAESCTDGIAARLSVIQGVAAASFVQQPRALLVRTGQTASLSVQVTGTPTPSLRWQSRPANASGAWADVAAGSGATSANYSTAALALADNGLQLRAVASNLAGEVASVPVTVSVSDIDVAPSVLTQPASLSVVAGSEAVFAVVARGTEALSYQWRRNGQPLSGANAPLLKLSNVSSSDASVYSVQVSNAAGNVTSADATLQVSTGVAPDVAPSIVTAPAAVQVNSGNTVTFAVGAAGSGPLGYQWLKNGLAVAGATAAFHSFTAAAGDNGSSYSVVVSNRAGVVTSAAAQLTVLADAQPTPVSISTQPSAQVQLPGGSATFAVAASGTGPLSYQWLKDGTPIVGATGAVLLLGSISSNDAASYSVTVGNALGSLTSAAASLTVVGAPTISSSPAAISVVEDSTAGFSVSATGSGLGYQWTRNGVAIGGATGASYTTPALATGDNGSVYAVVVYNGAGLVFSQNAVLTVTAAPVATGPIVLATSSAANRLSVFRADATTGALTSLGTTNTGSYPYKVAISPNGRFAFVTNIVSATIQPFVIDSTAGTVSAGSSRGTTNPYGVAVDPQNRFVWVSNYAAAGTVSTYLIDATTGALTPSGSPVSSGGTYPYAVAAHPSGNFIFAVNEMAGSISSYTVNATTGVPTLVGTLTGMLSPQSLVVSPGGQYVFVAEAGNNRVSSFAVNAGSGALTSAGSVFVGGAGSPAAIAVHPGGQVLYVANANSGNVATLSVNTSNGSVADLGTPVASGSGPASLALNAAGTRLYVVNTGSNSVTTYTVNPAGDTLTALGAATATASQPGGIAVSP